MKEQVVSFASKKRAVGEIRLGEGTVREDRPGASCSDDVSRFVDKTVFGRHEGAFVQGCFLEIAISENR
jgi:hypothetical protein